MKSSVVLVIGLLVVGSVQAQVYKCSSGGAVTYSERPCDSTAKPMDLKVYTPTPAERIAAIERAQTDREDAQVVDLQRQRNHSAARIAGSTNSIVREARRQNNCDWFRKQGRELYSMLSKQTDPRMRAATEESIKKNEDDSRLICSAR